MFIGMDGVIYLAIQSNYFKLCNFISSWKIIKNTIKPCRRLLLHKINRNMQRKSRLKCFVHSRYDVITLNSKLYNFITLWKLMKTPQNFLQGSFSVRLTKLCHKNGGKGLASGPLYWLKFFELRSSYYGLRVSKLELWHHNPCLINLALKMIIKPYITIMA